jgi:DNA repair exonuclease SbcCD ATPase subunit
VSVPQDDEGSFAAGRQALLEALTSLEQRAHDRAERMLRDAERAARQLTLESEQKAYQLTTETEERARQTISDAEQRAKQVTLEAATRVADLEQQLSEVRDNLESARAQIEEQVVAIRGQVEMARATLNTVRQQLTSGAGRPTEVQPARSNLLPRVSIPPLSAVEPMPARIEDVASPALSDLRAAVDALKKPRRIESAAETAAEVAEVSNLSSATRADEAASAEEPRPDAARRG